MLILIADIYFYTTEETAHALKNDLRAKLILRPAINFGNGYLFSGTLIADNAVEFLVKGKKYNVAIEMPTIEEEGYELVKDLVKIDNDFKIQIASQVIGYGKIIDFVYE